MIIFDHVTKTYSTNVGLDDVSVQIKKGDFVFLVGPSGAGKSTFIKLILKEINADKGSIKVEGQEVTTLSNREIPVFRRKLGTVFQDFRLLPRKTVYENVAFAMEVLHKTQRQIRKQVPQILALVGISDKAHKYPEELSAGEQQRVAIARAIVNNPTVLIADEPTGNLDPDTAAEIMDLLEQINRRGTTVVMVTHAKDIVDRMNKRVIAIEKGHIVRDEQGMYGFGDGFATPQEAEQAAPAQPGRRAGAMQQAAGQAAAQASTAQASPAQASAAQAGRRAAATQASAQTASTRPGRRAAATQATAQSTPTQSTSAQPSRRAAATQQAAGQATVQAGSNAGGTPSTAQAARTTPAKPAAQPQAAPRPLSQSAVAPTTVSGRPIGGQRSQAQQAAAKPEAKPPQASASKPAPAQTQTPASKPADAKTHTASRTVKVPDHTISITRTPQGFKEVDKRDS